MFMKLFLLKEIKDDIFLWIIATCVYEKEMKNPVADPNPILGIDLGVDLDLTLELKLLNQCVSNLLLWFKFYK
ncbi:hypothetical protein Avbf_00457 [Armadillidium vulgare]|nr:hypothetical protein Avbf_00457 [Armadillidium vulgare]